MTNKNNEPKLKPCPFCGGEEVRLGYSFEHYSVMCKSKTCPVLAETLAVKDKAEAIAAWNHRPTDNRDAVLEEQPEFVMALPHGLYRIHYKEDEGGGESLASVGSTHSGRRWFAPTNWTSKDEPLPKVASTDWSKVERVDAIRALKSQPADDWQGRACEAIEKLKEPTEAQIEAAALAMVKAAADEVGEKRSAEELFYQNMDDIERRGGRIMAKAALKAAQEAKQ